MDTVGRRQPYLEQEADLDVMDVDAEPPFGGGAVSVLRVAASLVALTACLLGGAAPAGAVTPQVGGTVDLRGIPTPGTNVKLGLGTPAYVGDVNGDGKGDVAIGVPTADPGQRANAGSVYVLFGGNRGRPGSGDFATIDLQNPGARGYRIDGAAAGDRLGTSIARLGYHVGDDELSDFAIGAPGASAGGSPRAGVVYVVPGSKEPGAVDLSKPDDTPFIRLTGVAAGDRTGQSLSAPPGFSPTGASSDVRRLIVGAPGADPNGLEDAGSAIVLTAPPADVPADRTLPISSMRSYRLDGRVAGGAAGSAVGWSLDFDGSRGSEVLVGAPRVGPDASGGRFAGEAYIVPSETSGNTTLGSPADGGFVVYGEPGMGLGASVTGLGDLSGDRLGDVAIGAPDASPGERFKAGSALVVLSRRAPAMPIAATAAPGSVVRIDGVDRYDNLGTVVAPTKLDAGSDNDLLVSAPRVDALGRLNAGAIYALLGSRIAAGAIDLAQLGDAGVRVAGPDVDNRSGLELAVNPVNRSLAIAGGRSSTGLLALTAPEPSPAAIAPSQVPGCSVTRDIELVVDGSPSMEVAYPSLRTAIDAMLSKPRSAPINLAAITIGRRAAQVFAPLTVPATGFASGRDIGTLRSLLDENVTTSTGAADYAAGVAAAQTARPESSALVLITDARQPPPAALPLLAGKRLYVLQLGGGPGARAGSILAAFAGLSRGRYIRNLDGATLPVALALVEADLTCDDTLSTRAKGAIAPSGGLTSIGVTLSAQRREATFKTELLAQTRTATLTLSFPAGPRGRASRCAVESPVTVGGLRVVTSGRRVVLASPSRVQRALAGRQVAFGKVLRLTGRCGRSGFLVLEVSGLERLPGARVGAAANSPGAYVGGSVKLRKPPKRRKINVAAVGSTKRKGRGR